MAAVKGLVTRSEPFFRTPKHGSASGVLHALGRRTRGDLMMIGAHALGMGGGALHRTWPDERRGPDRLAWIVVLLIQSVPYASSLVVSLTSAFPLPARLLGTSYRRPAARRQARRSGSRLTDRAPGAAAGNRAA